jgi:hypothetical protein
MRRNSRALVALVALPRPARTLVRMEIDATNNKSQAEQWKDGWLTCCLNRAYNMLNLFQGGRIFPPHLPSTPCVAR